MADARGARAKVRVFISSHFSLLTVLSFNELSATFVGLIVSEWGDRMERVMIALNRLFAITASEDATPSPALAHLLCAVPSGFIPFASEYVPFLISDGASARRVTGLQTRDISARCHRRTTPLGTPADLFVAPH